MEENDYNNNVGQIDEGRYQYTTVDYTHPNPRLHSSKHVSVHLQMNYDELVAGATIDVSRSDNNRNR